MFCEGCRYTKGGVMLMDLLPHKALQLDIFTDQARVNRQDTLMKIMDTVNHGTARNTLRFAATGTRYAWATRREQCSPAYTTQWKDLPIVGMDRN